MIVKSKQTEFSEGSLCINCTRKDEQIANLKKKIKELEER